jgi:hypothetical protein
MANFSTILQVYFKAKARKAFVTTFPEQLAYDILASMLKDL